MIAALLATLTLSGSPDVVAQADRTPASTIRVSLNDDAYFARGDRAKVRLRLSDDGYVVVLRADVDGRVRVLFPLDPGDDDFVRGGRDFELRGRGDRETFLVDDRTGSGTVLAAVSTDPFHYDRFVRGDHWDYRALDADRVRDDPEAGLLDLVTEMADSAQFDYDVQRYTVADGRMYSDRYYSHGPCFGCGWYGYGSGLRLSFVFGSPYRYGFYDPFFYDPLWYDPFFYDPFYDPFYYSFYYRSIYRPYRYSCFGDPFCFGFGGYTYAPWRTGGRLLFNRPAAPAPFVLPRQRFPTVSTAGRVDPPSRVIEPRSRPAPQPGIETRRRGDRGTVDRGRPERRSEPARGSRRETRGRNRDATVDVGRERLPTRVGRSNDGSWRPDRWYGGRDRLPARVGRAGGESSRREPSFDGRRDRLPGWNFQRPERDMPLRVPMPRAESSRPSFRLPSRGSESMRPSFRMPSRGSGSAPASPSRRRH